MEKNSPDLCNTKEECCGCGICIELCPEKAITLQEDSEGFLYPLINEEYCIMCGLCVKNCIFKLRQKEVQRIKK